ncbi:MAG: DUF1624 domain-containing protein [Ruminococcus sp.]|nr:DUF1624 domain-containing protein [Ruminococcus sp.]
MEQIKKRYNLIDSVRGLAIINMVLFHMIYDLVRIFKVNIQWFSGYGAYIWEQFICITFILISGISWHFSRHNLRRGIIVFACGCGITLFTYLFMPEEFIWFGILNLLGSAMLITILLDKPFKKINPIAGLIISILIFVVTKGVSHKFIGILGVSLLNLPDFLYSNSLFAFMGFPGSGFYSSDYFPLIPWLFLYFTGYFLWRIIKNTKAESSMLIKIPILNVIGKYSLIIYIVHQPVIYGILYLIFNFK